MHVNYLASVCQDKSKLWKQVNDTRSYYKLEPDTTSGYPYWSVNSTFIIKVSSSYIESWKIMLHKQWDIYQPDSKYYRLPFDNFLFQINKLWKLHDLIRRQKLRVQIQSVDQTSETNNYKSIAEVINFILWQKTLNYSAKTWL